MTGADNEIVVSIRAEVSRLLDGMKQASSATSQGAEEIRKNLLDAGKAADESGGAMEGFLEHVRALRSEGRVGSFLGHEIAGIGLASRGAAGEVGGLVAALAMGSGLGVAIETVKLLASAFGEIGGEEAKARVEFEKFSAELTAGTKQLEESITVQLMQMRGAAGYEIEAHKQLQPLYERRRELLDGIRKATDELNAAQAEEAASDTDQLAKDARIVQATKDKEKAQKELNEVLTNITERTTQVVLLANAEQEKSDEKAAAAKEKFFDDLHTDTLRALESGEKDYFKWAQAVDKANGDAAAAVLKYRDIVLKTQTEISQNLTNDPQLEEKIRKAKEEVRALTSEADRMGKAFGSAFAGMLDGTMSLKKGLADMAKVSVQAIIDAAIKIVQADAIAAAAEAAKSQAGIPIVGPVLAIGAMGLMEGAIMGLLGSIPSAAVGMPMVAQDMLVNVHKNEAILTSHEADDWRARGAAGGDVHVHINVTAMDGASVRRVVESNDFQRAVAGAVRDGRWRG
jgi:hypothetical protein